MVMTNFLLSHKIWP